MSKQNWEYREDLEATEEQAIHEPVLFIATGRITDDNLGIVLHKGDAIPPATIANPKVFEALLRRGLIVEK